jgi:hypothetical protein
LGAIYLQPVDDAMAKTGLFYARFMDDWVVLAPTHWKLRAAIRLVNQALAALKVLQHPDKTFVGQISRGFDFLGYTFSTVAQKVRLTERPPEGFLRLSRTNLPVSSNA